MSETIDILVYGLGAVGCLYSYILTRTECVRLTVVARSNYEAVKSNGINLKSKVYGDVILHPFSIFRTLGEASEGAPYDYVVFSHKALSSESLPTDLVSVVSSQTTLVIMQNGIGNEKPFRTVLPDNTILTCSLWMTATQISPGVVQHNTSIKTPIGLYPQTHSTIFSDVEQSRLHSFATLLTAGLMKVEIHEDMQVQKWEKVVWNAAFNSLTALTQLDTLAWLQSSPEALAMTRKLMKEIMLVAEKCGATGVRKDLDEVLLKQVLSLPTIRSSMQVDVQEGRLLEVDVIFGGPLRLAKEKGVDVPTLELVFALLTGINARSMQLRTSV